MPAYDMHCISCSLAKMGLSWVLSYLKPKKINLFRNVVVFLRWQPRGYGEILYGIVVSTPHTPLVTSLHVPTQNEVLLKVMNDCQQPSSLS